VKKFKVGTKCCWRKRGSYVMV